MNNTKSEKKIKRTENIIFILFIFLAVSAFSIGLFSTSFALQKKYTLRVTDEFSTSVIRLSSSFLSIFGILTLFLYREVNNRIQELTKEKNELQFQEEFNTEASQYIKERYNKQSQILSIKVNYIENYKSQITLFFGLSILLMIMSLGCAFGNQLILESYGELELIWFVTFSTLPMIIGMALQIIMFIKLLTINW